MLHFLQTEEPFVICIQTIKKNKKIDTLHHFTELNQYFRAPYPALEGSKNFTVFIKNNIEFPKFGVMRWVFKLRALRGLNEISMAFFLFFWGVYLVLFSLFSACNSTHISGGEQDSLSRTLSSWPNGFLGPPWSCSLDNDVSMCLSCLIPSR